MTQNDFYINKDFLGLSEVNSIVTKHVYGSRRKNTLGCVRPVGTYCELKIKNFKSSKIHWVGTSDEL